MTNRLEPRSLGSTVARCQDSAEELFAMPPSGQSRNQAALKSREGLGQIGSDVENFVQFGDLKHLENAR